MTRRTPYQQFAINLFVFNNYTQFDIIFFRLNSRSADVLRLRERGVKYGVVC